MPKETRLAKLSPDFAPALLPDPFWLTAGEVVLEESGDGLRARLAKALAGVLVEELLLPLGLEDQFALELLSMEGMTIAFGGIRGFAV